MIETSQAVGKPGKESTNSISPKSVRKLSKTEKTRKTKKQKVQPSEKNVGKCETRRTFTGHRVVSSASVDSGKIYSGKVDSGKRRITAVVSTGGKGKGNGKGNAWKMVGKRRVGTAVGTPGTLAKKCGLLKDQSIKSVVTDSDERTDRWMCETVIPGTPSYKRHLDGTVSEESSLSTQHDGWTLCDVPVKVATTSRKHSFTWSGKAQKQGTLAKKCGLFEDQSINSTVTDSDECTDGWICETVKPGTPSYKCHPDGTVPQDSALSTQHGGWTLSAMPPVRVDTKPASNSYTCSRKAQRQGTLAKKYGQLEDQSIKSTVAYSDGCTNRWTCETVIPRTPRYKCRPDGTVPQETVLSTKHSGWPFSTTASRSHSFTCSEKGKTDVKRGTRNQRDTPVDSTNTYTTTEAEYLVKTSHRDETVLYDDTWELFVPKTKGPSTAQGKVNFQ